MAFIDPRRARNYSLMCNRNDRFRLMHDYCKVCGLRFEAGVSHAKCGDEFLRKLDAEGNPSNQRKVQG